MNTISLYLYAIKIIYVAAFTMRHSENKINRKINFIRIEV